MPARPIDTAVVTIEPDFDEFTRTVDRELLRAFDGVERSASDSASDIEDAFADMGRRLDDIFDAVTRNGELELRQLSATADDTAQEISEDFKRSGEAAENSFEELRREANRELDGIDNHVGVTAGRAGRSFNVMGLAGAAAFAGIGAAAAAGLGALAFFGLSSAASMEQTQISFNALLGSVAEGERVFRELQQFAAETPFEFPEVAAAAKRFLAFNESIGLTDDQLQEFLVIVGDIASVTGAGSEGMNRIGFALGQIGSRGRVALEEINQISEAIPGFSALGAIADSFGVTTAQAMDMISAGEVDAVAGVNAILEGMQKFPGAAGAMEKQAQTLMGVFSTFKDVVSQALADSFAPVIPAIKESLTGATPLIGEALGSLAPALGSLIATILPLITGLVSIIEPIITPILGALAPALESLGPSLGPLGEVLGEIVVALLPLIPLAFEFLAAVLELATPILSVLVPVLELISPILQFMADAIGEFVDALRMIDWGAIGDAIGGFFSDLPGNIVDFLSDLPDMLSDFISDTFDDVMTVMSAAIGFFLNEWRVLPGKVISAVFSLGISLLNFFSGVWEDMQTLAVDAFNGLIELLLNLPVRVSVELLKLATVVGEFFTDIWDDAVDTVSNAIDTVVDFVSSIPERISDFASDVASGILNFFKGFLNRAIDGVNSAIATVDTIIPGTLPRIPRLAHGGIAFGPAIIGEDPGTSPEAAIPLGDARAMAMLREALGGEGRGNVTFQPGSITVNITGDTTASQARKIGESIGRGIGDVLNRTNVQTAVRVA